MEPTGVNGVSQECSEATVKMVPVPGLVSSLG
jgi:hypothetical protein